MNHYSRYLNVYIVIVHILDVLKQMYLQLKIAQKRILVYYAQCSLIFVVYKCQQHETCYFFHFPD